MKIAAIAPWFGTKRNIAQAIVDAVGPHSVYWTLFCGSLSDLLGKPSCTMETANDLHGEVINLARVLKEIDLAEQLYDRMYRTLMSEDLHREAAARLRERGWISAGDTPEVDRAYDFMLVSWMGRNGVAGTESYNQGFCVRFTANGGHAAKRFQSVVASIPAWHERLRNVTFLNRCAFALLKRIEDADGTAIYLDPPYFVKGATYVHDFEGSRKKPVTPKDCECGGLHTHERLAELCQRFRLSRVVVSYYEDPALQQLYPESRWSHQRIEVTKSLVNQGARMRDVAPTKAIEMLLVNQRVETGSLFGA